MKLKVNGEPLEVGAELTVAGLLERLEVGSSRVAVAVNGEVAPRSEHSRRVLRDGDAVEVIHAVAGG